MSILAHRLMRIIELHAEALAETLEARIATSGRCATYSRVSAGELKTLVSCIYGQLGQWLVTRTEDEIAARYTAIGERRAEQRVPAGELLWCIVLVKENLWDFLRSQEALEDTSQIFGELALMQLVDQFFDRAMYYAVCGYEKTRETKTGPKDAELKSR
jgi:hypothetical protein